MNPLPDARTVLSLTGARIEDRDENRPHGGLKWKSPREFIGAEIETARVPAETGAGSRCYSFYCSNRRYVRPRSARHCYGLSTQPVHSDDAIATRNKVMA